MRLNFSFRTLTFLTVLGLAMPVLLSCGSSVPTESPSSQLASPTRIPTLTPAAPQAQFPAEPGPVASPDIDATVTAMVSATIAAISTATMELPVTAVPLPDGLDAEAPATDAIPSPSVAQDFSAGGGTPVAEGAFPGADAGENPTDSPADGAGSVVPVPTLAGAGDSGDAASASGGEPDVDPSQVLPAEPTAPPEPTATPGPTATPRPTATPEPTPVPRVGSRSNPVPLGSVGVVQDFRTSWEIGVEEITPDAWDLIRETNQFNRPPGEGKQFYLLRLSVKNVGDQEAFFVAYVKATGEAEALGYTIRGDPCGVYPGKNSREVFPGGQFSLNVCWRIFSSDLPTLLMYWDESPTPHRMWFDLR